MAKPKPRDLPNYKIFNGLKFKLYPFPSKTKTEATTTAKMLKEQRNGKMQYRIVNTPTTWGDWVIYYY